MADEKAQIRTILERLEDLTERTVIKLTLDVTSNLVDVTPVDTGWARANWVPSIGSPGDAPVGSRGSDGASEAAAAQAAGRTAVLGYKLQRGRVFISNHVPYIQSLNDGSSQQAPAGFVQSAVRRAVRENSRRGAVV